MAFRNAGKGPEKKVYISKGSTSSVIFYGNNDVPVESRYVADMSKLEGMPASLHKSLW